jgi:hypothetical protein
MTLNLRPAKREKLGFDPRKARSVTDPADADPAMPDALEVAAQQDDYFTSTGKLIGPLHGVVFSIKDQYDTFDMRTTAGMDTAYANDRQRELHYHLVPSNPQIAGGKNIDVLLGETAGARRLVISLGSTVLTCGLLCDHFAILWDVGFERA